MESESDLSSSQRIGGLARVALAGLIWGTIPLVTRSADGASAIKVFFRVVCAALVIAVYMLARGEWRELFELDRKKTIQLSTQGLILTANWLLFLTALDMTNVATAELLAYTGPIFVAVLAPFVTRERFDKRILVPLALALTGIVVILLPQGLAVKSRTELLGAALAFASAITYAALLLRSKNILRGVSSSTLMLFEYGLASVVLAPVVVVQYSRGQGPTTPRAYLALVVLGVVQTAIAGFIFLGGMRRVRTDHAAILTYVEPASAVVFAALLLHEPLNVFTITGGVLVVLGGVLVARIETAQAPEAPIEAAGSSTQQ